MNSWGFLYVGAGWIFVWAILFVLIFLGIGFLVGFFFLRNLRDLLNRVSPQNRAMPAGHVWLNFIPVFNFGWIIYTVIKVRDSVQAEYQTRGLLSRDDLGYGVGMAFAVLTLAAWVLDWIPTLSTSVIASLASLGGLVCWIIYWVKTNGLKHRLEVWAVPPGHGNRPSPAPGYPGGPGVYGPQCGAALRCAACGMPFAAGDGFCRSCGKDLPG